MGQVTREQLPGREDYLHQFPSQPCREPDWGSILGVKKKSPLSVDKRLSPLGGNPSHVTLSGHVLHFWGPSHSDCKTAWPRSGRCEHCGLFYILPSLLRTSWQRCACQFSPEQIPNDPPVFSVFTDTAHELHSALSAGPLTEGACHCC